MATDTQERPQQTQGQQLVRMLAPATRKAIGGAGPVNTIVGTVASEAWRAGEVALVARMIETAVALDLNPLLNEIWLVRMKRRNGGDGALALVVGRDGYLKCARRNEDFRGVVGGAVYSNDTFVPAFSSKSAAGWHVVHRPKVGTQDERGELLGGWALLYRAGQPNAYFYAPATQYAKDADKSAWSYMDAMILKCAQSYVLRTTYGLSGPSPFDEMQGVLAMPGETGQDGHGEPEVLPPLDERVDELWRRAHDVDASQWPEGAIRARTTGASDEQIQAVAAELSAWLEEHEPLDAEVVDPAPDVAGDPGPERTPQHDRCDERYASDPAWAEDVDSALSEISQARADGLRSDTESGTAQARARFEAGLQRLVGLGAPPDWRPGTDARAE